MGSDLPDAEADWLTGRLVRSRFGAGEPYVRKGEVCRSVGFVASGVLRVIAGRDGDDRTTYFATESQFVSDYGSFLTDEPSRLRIEAVEPTELWLLPREAVREAYDRFPWGDRLGRVIAERLFVEAHRRLVSFYLDSAEQRYLALEREQPALLQRVPQHRIAEYVGVRPPSLSRIRARLAGKD
ncbi:Crp/Fnr family transcriptional regulator [Rubrivirga sp.]|uniref:Crp/Fnr family transcriptional regulator n=1 Tax=Rubrivirga sp. TaxID=1885344 RepID=UPI003C739833